MTKLPSVDEAVQRARQAQDSRIESIRALAEARQHVQDVRTDTEARVAAIQAEAQQQRSAADSADSAAFTAAVSAGWSIEELRKIGYTNPKGKPRKRAARKSPSS